MVNIRDLLQEWEKQTFSDIANDSWVDSIIENKLNENSVSLVVPTKFLFEKASAVLKKKEILFQHFNIAAVYDVGAPFLNTNTPFVALELTKDKPKHVKIAVYNGKTLGRGGDKTKNNSSGLLLGTTFTTEYNSYLKQLFFFANSGMIPDEKKPYYECRLIPFEEYDLEHPEPGYYTEKMVELRKFFDREDLLRLKDVADVYSPSQKKEDGFLFSFANASYPYDYASAKIGRRTDVLIKKGDILISRYFPKYYLFHDDLQQELYAPNSVFVVRPNRNLVSPEYLFLYLSCKTGENMCLLDAVRRGSMLSRLNRDSLSEFPVLKSKKSANFYAEHFKLLYLKGSKLGDYNAFISEAEVSDVKSTEDILNLELFENLMFYKREIVLSLVKNDLKELNICYKAKAYKATLIMAGSILEAVLIDWLSEMYKEDFFLEISSHTKWKAMKEKKAKNYDYEPKLADYISEIKDLGYPSWMDNKTREKFGKRATHIREKRNLVHAKLCLRECEKLDDKLCREVIEYLREVVRIRFKLDK